MLLDVRFGFCDNRGGGRGHSGRAGVAGLVVVNGVYFGAADWCLRLPGWFGFLVACGCVKQREKKELADLEKELEQIGTVGLLRLVKDLKSRLNDVETRLEETESIMVIEGGALMVGNSADSNDGGGHR